MSWLKRKPKNRRLGQTHVLDVKLRSTKVRATRLRLAAMAMVICFATIISLYLVWRTGEWALNKLVYENKAFAIQEIDIETDGVIAIDQLKRWAGIKPGDNLMALDLARVKRDLELVSVIRSVAVERVLPHTLRLRVSERVQVAQVYATRPKAGGGYHLTILHLDEDGYVMSLLDPRQREIQGIQNDEFLPVVSGVLPLELVPGRKLVSEQAHAGLKLIAAFQHSRMAGLVDLRRVDITSPQIVQVTTGQGSEITFSVLDLERQLRRWHEIYHLGLKNNKAIATLDLSVPNNIPARWIEASAAPPAPPKNKASQRNRRKNV